MFPPSSVLSANIIARLVAPRPCCCFVPSDHGVCSVTLRCKPLFSVERLELNGCRYLLHDRDQKFCREFRETLAPGGVKCLPLPARSPNLNAYAEHWVRSIKEECLSQLILFGEKSLQRVVSNYLEHSPGTQPPRQG